MNGGSSLPRRFCSKTFAINYIGKLKTDKTDVRDFVASQKVTSVS